MRLSDARNLVRPRRAGPPPVDGVLAKCHSVEDLRHAARRKLPLAVFDYVDGGADKERTLASNRAALDQWSFQPRSLNDVSDPDLSVEVFGRRLALPLALAPTGYTRMVHPDGEIAVAQGALSRELPYCLSTVGSTSIEDLAATGHPRLWFQLYVLRDRGHTRALVERAAAVGYEALEVSVDTAVAGTRARDLRNGLTIPPSLTGRAIVDIGMHFGYWTKMLRSPVLSLPSLTATPTGDARARGHPTTSTVADVTGKFDHSFNWDDLAQVRQWWSGPLLVKGPLSPEDAGRAVDAGVDGVHLSNHGGRQLDRTRPSIDMIRPVREAVSDKAVVVVDSGLRDGADIAIALARGADMCMVGRPYLYGLAVAGAKGVEFVADLLQGELRRTLQLLGVRSLPELRDHADSLVVRAGPDGNDRLGAQSRL